MCSRANGTTSSWKRVVDRSSDVNLDLSRYLVERCWGLSVSGGLNVGDSRQVSCLPHSEGVIVVKLEP